MSLFIFTVDETRCMNCAICMDVCPVTCLDLTRAKDTSFHGFGEEGPKLWMMEKPFLPVQERCTGCQVCVRECPTNAITVVPDASKPSTLQPKPVIILNKRKEDDGYWHPLSEYTMDYLKRPTASPWTNSADWKPMTKMRGEHQTWKTMDDS